MNALLCRTISALKPILANAYCRKGFPMKRFRFPVLLALAVFLLTAHQSHADNAIGIVIMHGKDGTASSNSIVGKLADRLSSDYTVRTPEMPWSKDNGLNQTLENTFKQIDAEIAALKAAGATKIVVGGHSMGAAAALAYAITHPGLAGVLMMAPGHRPDLHAKKNYAALEKARELVAAGKPHDMVEVMDFNQGQKSSRDVEAEIAISWFGPEGMAVMQNAAPKLSPDIPVLFILGEEDPLLPDGKSLIYDKLPANPKSAYTVVPGGHKQTPIKGAGEIKDWLSHL